MRKQQKYGIKENILVRQFYPPKEAKIIMSQRKESEDLYRVVHKEGTHLASSNDTKGAFRGNLLDNDTNKPVGNAEWVKVDKSEYDSGASNKYQESRSEVELSEEQKEMAAFIGEVIAAGTVWVLSEVVAPRVKFWWQDRATPSLKKMWYGITDKKKTKQTKKDMNSHQNGKTEIAASRGIVLGIFPEELDEAYEKYVNDMTSEEAQRELLDIFILSAILCAKIRKLSNSRIRKNGDIPGAYLEGKEVVEKLSTPEFLDSVNRILENNPSLLEEKSASLTEILGRNLIINGQYVPIENNKFKEALA